LYILKNNHMEAVMMSFKEYERLHDLEEIFERLEIKSMLEDRISNYSREDNVSWDEITTGWTFGGGEWYHLALTYDTTTLKMYKDGILVDTLACNGSGTGTYTTSTKIGKGTANKEDLILGGIDEVRVYDYALDATAIQAIYDSEV